MILFSLRRKSLLQRIDPRLFCAVRTKLDTLAAIDTSFRDDSRFSFPHTNCFGRAAFHAVGAAKAPVAFQINRMKKLIHWIHRPVLS